MTRAIVRVRHAVERDVPALLGLLRDGDPSLAPARHHGEDLLASRLTRLLQAGDGLVLIAADDEDAPAGVLVARWDDASGLADMPALHVSHLVVAGRQRRRGAGRALLVAAVQAAEHAGVEHVLATVASGSREGNRYLARLGFGPTVVARIATVGTLRRSLGLNDTATRVAVLRRARLARANRSRLSGAASTAGGQAAGQPARTGGHALGRGA